MPIYAYRCGTCGFQQDVLQKMSDPRLVNCPSCGNATFQKQVTAAGFQLKGSGWYVTDFRNPAAKDGTKAAKTEESSGSETKGDASAPAAGADSGSSSSTTPATTSDAKPAPAPSPAKASPPASGTS